MASVTQSPVSFTGNLVSKPTASDILRSLSNGVPLRDLGRAQLGAKKRVFTISAKVRKVKKHEYPWPEDPDLNVKGGVLSHLSPFKPLKVKPKPVTLDFEKPLMDLQKKIIDVWPLKCVWYTYQHKFLHVKNVINWFSPFSFHATGAKNGKWNWSGFQWSNHFARE